MWDEFKAKEIKDIRRIQDIVRKNWWVRQPRHMTSGTLAAIFYVKAALDDDDKCSKYMVIISTQSRKRRKVMYSNNDTLF